MPEEKQNPIIEQLNQSLAETLAFIKDAGSTGVEFAKEQTPLYIQELLTYNFAVSIIMWSFGVILILISLYHIYQLNKLSNSNWLVPFRFNSNSSYKEQLIPNPTKEDWEKSADPENGAYRLRVPESKLTICIIVAVITMLAGNAFFWNNTEWVKIKLAPRVYMVEQIKILLR